MARVKKLDGLTDFGRSLTKLGALHETERVFKTALYDGAAVVADAMRAEIDALPVGNKWGTPEHPIDTVTATQKRGLQESFGLSTIKRADWKYTTSAGFDGYNESGQANAMIAAAVEGGTSFRRKNPFVTRALRKSQAAANARMQDTAESTIKSIMEG